MALGLALAGPWPCPWLARGLALAGPWPGSWPALGLALGLALGWPLARIPQDRQCTLADPTRDLGMQSDCKPSFPSSYDVLVVTQGVKPDLDLHLPKPQPENQNT